MLHASLDLYLPTEPYPRSSRVTRLLRMLFGEPDELEGHEHVVGEMLDIFERALFAFRDAGFDDVVSILVDDEPVYVDTKNRVGDLSEALELALAPGSKLATGHRVRVVLSHRSEGAHSLVTVDLSDDVVSGAAPLLVRANVRFPDLRVRSDEAPSAYGRRVRAWVSHSDLDTRRTGFADLLTRVRGHLEARLEPPRVDASEVNTRVVIPGATQVGRLRHLGFFDRVRRPTYRPTGPKRRLPAAYDDTHAEYFFDPYHDLLCWLLTLEGLEGRFPAADVHYVYTDEREAFSDAAPQPNAALEVDPAHVVFGDKTVKIDASVPRVAMHEAELGSPYSPGYGGEGG